jgi:hypothetical protein
VHQLQVGGTEGNDKMQYTAFHNMVVVMVTTAAKCIRLFRSLIQLTATSLTGVEAPKML